MVEAIMPSKWGPWSSMNHSDSAKKFFAEMMFHAAKQEPPKSRFLPFSHLRVRGVFFENSRGRWIPHPRVKDEICPPNSLDYLLFTFVFPFLN